ncbi:hypothetical protein R5R35_000453 [Gryllus longicercus]|uniref:Uncharacterized protein n=1 Tax=Gryllus longicercus TaxID=2509291 RepID=A0AAN9VKR7_9ORTH
MYQPTLLLEALLREEKLDKKFISLLLACDEQRAFACQTPTMARETVKSINKRFRDDKLGPTVLLKLTALLKQCPDAIFVENCVFWISECLKVTGSRRNEEKAFDIIKMCLEKSSNIKNLTNLISKRVVPRLVDQLLESKKPTYSAIQCLQILFQYYSEPCKAQWKSLQKYLLNFMDEEDQNLVKYTSRCLCYLPLITENSNNQESAWSKLLTELCVAANSVLHQLFKKVPEIVISSSLGEIAEGIMIKPIKSDDSILLAQRLAQRLINILIFIEGMLVESCDCIKEIRIDLVITLAYRGLSVSYDMLKNSSTMWQVALISVLPDIQTQLLNLLKSLVSCCKGGLLKFGPLFCNIIIKTLKDQELCNQYKSDQSLRQELHIKPISSTCEAALRALCALVLTSGSRLTLSVHKKLQEFVVSHLVEVQQSCSPEDIPAPYNVPECRLHLYQLLLVLTLHPHPQWPPPTNYAFSLFPRGQQDSSPEVIKLCTTSMVSIHKMVHLPSVESPHTLFPFNTTNILNEKENEKQGISLMLTKISKSIKVCKKSQNARSVKALKRSLPSFKSDTFPKRKRFSEDFIESLVNTKALQSTDKDWIVKRISKNQSKKTEPERNRKEIRKAVDLQKTIKKRKPFQISDILRKELVKYHSLVYDDQDISEEITLVDLVSDSEINDSDKILHSNASCEELITIDDLESLGSENYVRIEEKMEELTKDMEEKRLSPFELREIGEGINETEKTRDKDTRNTYDIENDYNIGANEEINDAEKIVKEAKSVIIDKECRSLETTDPENHCQVQSEKGTLEVSNIINTDDCETKINTDTSNSDNPSHVLTPGTLQNKTVEKAKLPTKISSSAEQSPSNEVLTANHSDIESFVVDNSQKLTSSISQMLLQGADVEEMSSSQISSISLSTFKETNLLEKEHTYVVKSHSDLIEMTNLTFQTENSKIKVDNGTIDLKVSKVVNRDKICLCEASNEVIPPPAMKGRTNIETIDELSTRNNEKAASLDEPKQELVTHEEKPLPTVTERQGNKIVEEPSTRKQDVPALNNEKATSLDGSKHEPVSLKETSLLTLQEGNVMKTIDESAVRKQDAPATNNKKAAPLEESKQELVSHEEKSLPTVTERKGNKIVDEPSTRKQDVPALNSEKATSLDRSKHEPVSLKETSLLTLQEGNVLKTIDESAVRKQDAPATNNKKAASLDKTTQDPVSCEEMSLLIVEERNDMKTIDESSTRKEDVPSINNENTASLDGSQQEPIPLSESIRKEIEIHYVEVNEVFLDESSEVRNKQVKRRSKGVDPNDIADPRKKGSPVDVNETKIALLADLVEVIDLEAENDRKNNVETELVGTTADAIITGKKKKLPDSSCVVTPMSTDNQESVTSLVIQKDVLSESTERTYLEEASSDQQHTEEDSQMKEKEQNNSESAEEDSISPKSA